MITICKVCNQDHAKPLKFWCDRSSLEIKNDELLETCRKLQAENNKAKAKINDLKMRINVFKSDYSLMSFQLKDLTDHSIEACLERMNFRKPLFENLDSEPSECFYE